MENPTFSPENIDKRFINPQEELEFLREKVAKQEQESNNIEQAPREETISRQIDEYKREKPEVILEENYRLPEKQEGEILLKLSPEEHDDKIAELLGILQEKGIKNTLSIVDKMGDIHIVDDFHRFLIEYIKEGFVPVGVKEKSPLWKQLHMTLFEISLPYESADENAEQKPLKELISSMEQLYAGMLSVSGEKKKEKNHITFEIAVSEGSEEAIFYVAVPDDKTELFEKQVLSIFPQAKVIENKDDYNIFNEKGISVGAYGKVKRNKIYPLKTYDIFDYDPLNILLSAFSKLAKEDEGAAVQLVFSPVDDPYHQKYKYALDRIQKGTSVGEAINMPETLVGSFAKEIFGKSKKKNKDDNTPPIVDQIAVDQITNKISSPIVDVNLRIVASAGTQERAEAILSDIEAVFNQFEESQGNGLLFKHLKKANLKALLRDFSYRRFIDDQIIPLNLKEITTIYHFPSSGISSSRELKQSKAGTAPAPLDMSENGVLLGINKFRNSETEVHITREDRLRHFYTIGQTGTGKSTLLKNMAVQDIINGDGVCVIDPHGVDINDILGAVPEHRMKDVIYFDPGYTERPMALNMLEYDERFPEQKTFVVNEMFSIFQKLYGDTPESMGPMFEQYFRNATLLVIEDPASGNTLLDVSRVLVDEEFRNMKLSKCGNPIVVQFWREIAEKAGGESSLANIVPYITNKFDVFLANDIMRPIIGQSKSSFNFREIMDGKKILLVNLAKGRLGDINAHLIGLILVGKILMAALSRVDDIQQGGQNAPDFYLHLDEFQNITTDSISTILSEARKYKLGLSIAHQFIAQLDDKIKNAVFGNVGSVCAFRVGADDAEYLKNQFEPVFTANDLMNIDNRNAYLKMLVDGRPVKPFSIETLPPAQSNKEVAENLKQLSHLTYGRDRNEVEEEIRERYNK
ncbi:TraM recognition domain-containing protein [bacterium]|nr:TraM recognition domain-containing protein [bacterium]